jgi:hypothetical protein
VREGFERVVHGKQNTRDRVRDRTIGAHGQGAPQDRQREPEPSVQVGAVDNEDDDAHDMGTVVGPRTLGARIAGMVIGWRVARRL